MLRGASREALSFESPWVSENPVKVLRPGSAWARSLEEPFVVLAS